MQGGWCLANGKKKPAFSARFSHMEIRKRTQQVISDTFRDLRQGEESANDHPVKAETGSRNGKLGLLWLLS